MKRWMLSLCCLLSLPMLGEEEFLKKFMPAYQNNDRDTMKKIVALYPQEATDVFLARMERFAVEMEDEMGKQIDAMKQAWADAYKNNFFENEYKYLSLIDSATRRRRTEFLNGWRRLNALFNQTKMKANEDSWKDLETNLPALADGFEQIGDLYFASLARYVSGQVWDPSSRFNGKGANPRAALEHYKKCLELRERLDLKDSFYNGVKAVIDRMEKLYQAPSPDSPGSEGGSGSPDQIPFKEGSDWQKFTLTPMKGEASLEVDHFGYDYDDLFTTWIKIQTTKKTNFVSLVGFNTKASILQEGAAKFSMDQDGDGKGDVRLKAAGKPEILEFTRSFGPNDSDTYAIYITTGSEREIVQRVEANIAPTIDLGTFFYRSAAVRSADVMGIPFRFFDDNADGKFNAQMVEREVEGMKPGKLPVLDSWIFGKDKRVAPASAYVNLTEKWFRAEFDKDATGKEIRLREVDVKESMLQLQVKAPAFIKPNFFIVRALGSYEGAYFDIAGGKPVKVPAGGYEIFYGIVRTGKAKQAQKLAILKGNSKTYIAEPGKTTTIQIGEPFHFDFVPVVDQELVTLPGHSVGVLGSAGERYELLWDEVPAPELQVRAGAKVVGKPHEMKRAAQADLNQSNDWGILWHPLDLKVEIPKTSDKVQVKLFQPKHKWFGKIESDWK